MKKILIGITMLFVGLLSVYAQNKNITVSGIVIDPEPTEPESTSTEDDTVTENNNGDQNSDEKSIPLSTAEKKAVNSLLIQLEKLKNIDRTKYTIEKQNYCRSTARTSKDGVLQLCQLFFS
jgi:hypothetical protein